MGQVEWLHRYKSYIVKLERKFSQAFSFHLFTLNLCNPCNSCNNSSRYGQRLPGLQFCRVIDNAPVGVANFFPMAGGFVKFARDRSQRVAIAHDISSRFSRGRFAGTFCFSFRATARRSFLGRGAVQRPLILKFLPKARFSFLSRAASARLTTESPDKFVPSSSSSFSWNSLLHSRGAGGRHVDSA